ncbi:MAG: type I-E CRISPR-associated endoribonuclease Cas2 [Chloroflexi bacterium]|nr:type I-E CRISPR-associated endoribonuclease Cas2 [Chloroflexota bacterium]
MVIMILEKVPPALKGDLTRWLMEVRSGVYIGHVSALVRDKLWERCSQNKGAGSVFQAWSTNNEQRFQMRLSGSKTRRVVDWEGLQLIQTIKDELEPVQKRRIRSNR